MRAVQLEFFRCMTGFPCHWNTSILNTCDAPFYTSRRIIVEYYIYNDYSQWHEARDVSMRFRICAEIFRPPCDIAAADNVQSRCNSFSRASFLRKKYRLNVSGGCLQPNQQRALPGTDNNPADGPPTQQANGSYTNLALLRLNQQKFSKILRFALKLALTFLLGGCSESISNGGFPLNIEQTISYANHQRQSRSSFLKTP